MYAQLWKLPFILFIVLISTVRAGAALSDLITPHCVWGSLTSGRSCGWQDSPNPHPPPGPFFCCGTGSSQSSSVPADNTNKQRKQWRSGENSRRSDLHDLSLFYKHKAKWRASEAPGLAFAAGWWPFFPYSGQQLSPNIWSLHQKQAPSCKAYVQFVRYSCTHPYSPKKEPLAKAFLQNIAGNATMLTLKLNRT